MNKKKGMLLSLAILTGIFMLLAATIKLPERGTVKSKGAMTAFGNGWVETYADVDPQGIPSAIGVSFSKTSFENLPTTLSDGHHCYDVDNNGTIDTDTECLHSHEWIQPLPSDISRKSDIPFKWVLLNWNPQGHMPEGVWNKPHFDVHFYIDPIENVFSLMSGPCGAEKMRCDQYKIAQKPVPARYMNKDFADVGAVVPAMGNHLVDASGPEFHGAPFTRSWLYGAYDGHVTFYEEMLSLDYLTSRPNACYDIKATPEVEKSGYYPSTVCTRFDPTDSSVNVSLEGFVYRKAKLL